jgi:hypothetical protein
VFECPTGKLCGARDGPFARGDQGRHGGHRDTAGRDAGGVILKMPAPVVLADRQPILVKTYKGRTLDSATAAYKVDAVEMAAKGYLPTSQSWAPGEYGCGSFLVALLLCVILIGIIIFFYMLIVKRDGTLTVTYELRARSEPSAEESLDAAGQRRPCPNCAELILPAARVCRFCTRELPEGWGGGEATTRRARSGKPTARSMSDRRLGAHSRVPSAR